MHTAIFNSSSFDYLYVETVYGTLFFFKQEIVKSERPAGSSLVVAFIKVVHGTGTSLTLKCIDFSHDV